MKKNVILQIWRDYGLMIKNFRKIIVFISIVLMLSLCLAGCTESGDEGTVSEAEESVERADFNSDVDNEELNTDNGEDDEFQRNIDLPRDETDISFEDDEKLNENINEEEDDNAEAVEPDPPAEESEQIAEAVEEPEGSNETGDYTFSDISATMYTTDVVNVRDLPDLAGNKVGKLSSGESVNVTGRCNETGWYRIDGGYVSNDFMSDNVPVKEIPVYDETPTNISPVAKAEVETAEISSTAKASNSNQSVESVTVDVPAQSNTNGANLVWVPVKGGTKYHIRAGCSGMINPVQVSVEEAIARNYTACKKCYK